MKNFLICLVLFISFTTFAYAKENEVLEIPYKNINEEYKIRLFEDTWTDKISRQDDYFIKFISDGTGNYSEYYKSTGDFAFTTGCQYEFLYKGNLIGYSNQDLKFYDFTFINNEIYKRGLSEAEIQILFPDFDIIKISEFSPNTNSLKIKKKHGSHKIIILNDTEKNFYHYSFSSGNSKFDIYPLAGFISVNKKGMIQFSHFGENSENTPWYILLIR